MSLPAIPSEEALFEELLGRLIIETQAARIEWKMIFPVGKVAYVWTGKSGGKVLVREDSINVSGNGRNKDFKHRRQKELWRAIESWKKGRSSQLITQLLRELEDL